MKVTKEHLCQSGIVPVIVINDANKAVPLAEALLAGGVKVIEITFRTAAAGRAIAEISARVPQIIVGAGTIINTIQLNQALEAGARFIVTPGLDSDLIREAQSKSITILPGVLTPSEIMQGLKLGVEIFKFFPAENYGGLNTIKTLSAVFAGISFVPTGGISINNLAEYLQNNRVAAIGGSWLATSEMIDQSRFLEITDLTVQAMNVVRSIRSSIGGRS